MNLAWFHCFSGIAGDMALGSLVDAGADIDAVRRMLETLPVGGWELEAEPVLRGGIAGTAIHVHVRESTVVRTAAHIQGLVTEARLPERVQQRALATFGALAEAEGRLHRRPPEQVHFHEVGGVDAIIDVVGTCVALELLDVDEVRSSAVTTGIGMIRSAHGQLPNPAPAVVELLRGALTQGIDVPVELTTPTGAALLAALSRAFGPMPADAHHRDRVRRRQPRLRRPTQPHPGGARRRRRSRAGRGTAGRAARGERRRRDRRGARSHRSPNCSPQARTTRGSRRS